MRRPQTSFDIYIYFIPFFVFCFGRRSYENTKILRNVVYFFIIHLSSLALQMENIIKKITQPKRQKCKKLKLPKWNETNITQWDIFQIVVVFGNFLEILTMVLCTYPAVLAQGVERVGLLVFRVLLELRWALWTACARLAVAEWPLRSNWGLGLFRCFVSWIQAKVAPVMRSPVNLIKSRALLFSMNIWKQFYQSLILSTYVNTQWLVSQWNLEVWTNRATDGKTDMFVKIVVWINLGY